MSINLMFARTKEAKVSLISKKSMFFIFKLAFLRQEFAPFEIEMEKSMGSTSESA